MNQIIEKLADRGFSVEAKTVHKNGVDLEGICFTGDTVSPIFYFDDLNEIAIDNNFSLDELVDYIVDLYENIERPTCFEDILNNREQFLDYLYIGMQRKSDVNLCKRDFELDGIESYLYLRIPSEDGTGVYTTKIFDELLEELEIDLDEAWERAKQNVIKESTLISLSMLLFGEELPGPKMYVLSNKSGIRGASSILDKELLRGLKEKEGFSKVLVLPSSVNEFILMPYTEETDIEQMSAMVEHINQNEVEESEWLSDKAYILEI